MNIGQFLVAYGFKGGKKQKAPHYWPDITPYKSPLGTGLVTSRSQRREELKRAGCREVDPSEKPHKDGSRYSNPDFVRKHEIPVER